MRSLFLLCFLANLMLNAASLWIGPPSVAIHFGSGGQPDGWAPSYINALLMTMVNVVIFVSFYFAPLLIRKMPAKWINLPNRSYWLKEENRAKAASMLSVELYRFGAATFVFMFVVTVLVIKANLSEPVRLDETNFWRVFGLYIAYTLYWTLRLVIMFRIPRSKRY